MSKKIIAAFAAMAAVIIALVVALIVTNSGKGDKKNSSSSKAESSSVASAADSSEKDKDSSKEDSKKEDSSSKTEESSQEESKADSEEEKEDSDEKEVKEGYVFSYTAGNSWEDGSTKMCGLEMGITNYTDEAVKGWTLELEIEDLKSCDGWNGDFSVKGNTLTIKNVEYNGDIPKNGTVTPGCNIGTGSTLNIKSAKLNGTECTIKKGKAPQNSSGSDKKDGDKTKDTDVKTLLARSDKAEQGDDWLHTDGSKILDKDGKQVWLTGVNWFGYNTGTNTFDGLWNSELVPTVKAIADHGFNLIRVPISAELINQWADGEYPQANYNNAYNEELNSMNSLEIFDYFLKLAEENGMKVMPDIHSAETDAAGHNANLWYTDKVSVKEYYAALEWLAERYKDNDTIIAFDLKNEPHGKPNEGDKAAIWNDSKDANNWKYVAETAASKVLAKNPNVLIMVEGTEIYPKNIKKNSDYSSTDNDDYYFNWWGGNLRAVKDYPIDLGEHQDKLVYSPHDYGPTVYQQPWFEGDYDYDSLKKDCWQDNWLYIQEEDTAPLLIGEWGGFMKEPNLMWMTHMRTLIKKYHLNHTFWCFNAKSGDTGGLVLDDFTTWDDEKYEFVKEVLWQEGGKFVGL
ncbi:MAG: cellulase family glycosylhydrolase, partial [Ruminococcus sp.]|nr:cellulase family glycosylhydrolase [Ruminococcus sp.]